MNKCLPLVERSQAEVLILLSEKNIDGQMSNNATNGKYLFYHNKKKRIPIFLIIVYYVYRSI